MLLSYKAAFLKFIENTVWYFFGLHA